jgi:hypothetical protein
LILKENATGGSFLKLDPMELHVDVTALVNRIANRLETELLGLKDNPTIEI